MTPHSQVSERQAAVNLVYDVMRVERGIDACMSAEMPQPVYDTAVSFAFNVGVRAACSSTFVRYIMMQHWLDACNELRRWVFVKGVKNRGLENRRAAETAYCLRGVKSRA